MAINNTDENGVLNLDNLDDDEFMAAMEEAGSQPIEDADEIQFEQHEEEEDDFEDTDQSEDSTEDDTEDTDTNEDDDDYLDETDEAESDDEEDDDGENAQVEVDGDGDEEDNDESDTDETEESEDDADSEDDNAGANDTDEENALDYKAEYAKLQSELEDKKKFEDFYNEVTSEFIANGKKTRGFDDPKKIIQAQQMAAGFSEKMIGFKKYRPFMNALKEKGMLDTPDKFNLAMNLLDGDPEALKQHIKNLEIDPFEMDMENINYTPTNQIASDLEIALDDVMESASRHNVQDEVRNVLNGTWDDDSVIELLEDPENSADLINHISSGAYDVVQGRIAQKRSVDVNGSYSRKPMIEQYREAAREIEQEIISQQQLNAQEQEVNQDAEADRLKQLKLETQKTEEAKQQAYAEKVRKRENAKADEARKKAASLSKKKPGRRKKKITFDPGQASDEEFNSYLDGLIHTQP